MKSSQTTPSSDATLASFVRHAAPAGPAEFSREHMHTGMSTAKITHTGVAD